MQKFAMITAALLLASAFAASSDRLSGNPAPIGSIDLSVNQARNEEVSLVEPPVVPLTERFEHAVDRWIAELSREPEFSEWKKAERRREPLGPGLHGWIVLLSVHGKEVGYLVVTVDPEGKFMLTEYGSGEYPLFSLNTLYQSLVRQELIPSSVSYEHFLQNTGIMRKPIYFSPLQAIWSITLEGDDYWLDGKTGELLPLDSGIVNDMRDRIGLAPVDPISDVMTLDQSLTLPEYDPFYDLSWLRKPPLMIKDPQNLQALLNRETRLTYVTEPYEGTVLFAFSVTGYHEWSLGGPFIRLDHFGPRYVPAEAIMPRGKFYASKGERAEAGS